jgi:localization factor PodJL
MKSGGPWNLRGLRPEAREAVRTAARRSGVSVGEWLNDVIEPDDEEDDEPTLFSDYDDQDDDERPLRSRSRRDGREPQRRDDDREPRQRSNDREAQQRGDERGTRRRGDDRELRQRDVERESPEPRERHRDRDEERPQEVERRPEKDSEFQRESARTRGALNQVHSRLDKLSQQLERLARSEAAARQLAPQRRAASLGEGRNDANGRLTGAPAQPRRPIERPPAPAAARNRPATNADSVSIDDAVAEIAARQRALDGDPAPQPATRDVPAEIAARQRVLDGDPSPQPAIREAPAEIAARQRVLDSEPVPQPAIREVPVESVIDIEGLERQLRQITARIESLGPSSDLESSVAAIRGDLTDIARLITEALPRRAVESLEIEVKALAQRIEHSRQCGVDMGAIAGLERGLGDVREALQNLKPAESLVGFDEAVRALSQKVDMIVAKDDPAALQQLETAIGALRGIVSHVASNETLTKVAEDVRSLAGKVDTLASTAASGQSLSALENRIETLTNALTASTEAGTAVPHELEKLLTGLIEKLEWVQLTHTDHAALAHLEDRIATLVQRFDASDARLGHLEAIERGIADLLVHIDELRGSNVDTLSRRMPAAEEPLTVHAIEREVAEIKQSEQRTLDSLEAVQDTVEHVVDRLAMIESGIRETAPQPEPVPEPPVVAPEPKLKLPAFAVEPVPEPAPEAPSIVPMEEASPRTAARKPIDPSLPPDHPLEPGSSRSRPTASAADRIAASEAAVSSTKPPVIADPGQKPNFIAAARRAAQAAAAAGSNTDAKGKGSAALKNPSQRTRPLIIAGAAALIVIGCIQIASRLFEAGPQVPPPAASTEESQPQKAAEPEKAPPPVTALPDPAPPPPAPQPPAAAAPAPLPVPSTPPAALPAPQPNPKSGANISTKPTQQTASRDSSREAVAAVAAATDVTGSLPRPATPLGDKLPATIGGPALRAAALSGDAAAAYEIGTRFADGHGVPRSGESAALWFERAAKQGLAPAQFRLGGFYEKGIGVKKDLAAARDLYLAAAGKGNGKAMHNLAVLYAEGVDGPADYANAAHWFREAADHGVTDSQYNLGILYARGTGVTQNYAESYKWFALAAIQGDQDAAKKSDEVAARLDQQSLAAARLAVKTWSVQSQPDDAINVKTPPSGWDATASAAPAAKPKQQPQAAKTPARAPSSTNQSIGQAPRRGDGVDAPLAQHVRGE